MTNDNTKKLNLNITKLKLDKDTRKRIQDTNEAHTKALFQNLMPVMPIVPAIFKIDYEHTPAARDARKIKLMEEQNHKLAKLTEPKTFIERVTTRAVTFLLGVLVTICAWFVTDNFEQITMYIKGLIS